MLATPGTIHDRLVRSADRRLCVLAEASTHVNRPSRHITDPAVGDTPARVAYPGHSAAALGGGMSQSAVSGSRVMRTQVWAARCGSDP